MKEIKCPKCQSVFQVDEADYASILSQVKNSEFEAEINRRINELKTLNKAEQETNILKAQQQYQELLSKKEKDLNSKEQEINRLKLEL